jgi:hypothetical protein
MAPSNRLWSMYDGEILEPDITGSARSQDYDRKDSISSWASGQRSVSSSSTSSNSSASSALSDFPLMPKNQSLKVPVYVAASLAHHGFDVDDLGKVTWRENASSHPRNRPALRKLYDVSTGTEHAKISDAII